MAERVSAIGFDARKVSKITHGFSNHPALQFDALRQLALRLDARGEGHVKFVDPSTKPESEFRLATSSYDGRSIDGVFDALDAPGTWLAIYEAQKDPQFRKVVEEVIDSTRHLLTGADSSIFDVDAYIFISKAPAVTPFHIDQENNFLLQIHGSKHLSVWNPDDRKAVDESSVEDWIVRHSLSSVKFSEEKLAHAAYDENMSAGEGIFMPSTSAHMSRTEDTSPNSTVSATVGFVFYTAATKRRANIYALNVVLRRLGFTPKPPGSSRPVDTVKYLLGYCAIRLLVRMGKLRMPRGI